jgi:anti-sigma B factor antagonist
VLLTQDPPFAVDHRRFGDRAVVAVSGELDMATAPQLRTVLALAMGGRPAELWIDLSPTTFIDSTGLHVLLDIRQRFAGALAIVCPPGHLRRVFEIAGLTETLPLCHDVRAVRAALASNEATSREDSTPAVS